MPARRLVGRVLLRLGSKPMAMDLLGKVPLQFATIKLLADMGETRRALQVADANMRGNAADVAGVYAGDVCRVAGQYPRPGLLREGPCRAGPRTGQGPHRAQPAACPGQYRGHQAVRSSGSEASARRDLSRRQPRVWRQLSVEVVVRGGRIEAVRVTSHQEKQFYSSIADTPRKIIEKQGVKGVDATSSATITSEAIINATAKALNSGMK